MEAFHVNILHVLLMLGLIAANVSYGNPLQRKLEKGKINNYSCFRNWNRIKNCMANWNNRNNKAQIEERQTLLFYYIVDWLFSSFIVVESITTVFTIFYKHFCQKSTSCMNELPIFHMLQDKQTILTVIRVFYLMEKNPFSSELSNVTHSLKWYQ